MALFLVAQSLWGRYQLLRQMVLVLVAQPLWGKYQHLDLLVQEVIVLLLEAFEDHDYFLVDNNLVGVLHLGCLHIYVVWVMCQSGIPMMKIVAGILVWPLYLYQEDHRDLHQEDHRDLHQEDLHHHYQELMQQDHQEDLHHQEDTRR